MRVQQKNVGRVIGYSTYELAVRSGKFSGTLDEFLDKEMTAYNLMVKYGDELKSFIEQAISGITKDNENIDLSEVIAARDTYKTLADRLNASEDQMDIILDRLNSIDPTLIDPTAIKLSGTNKNVELRNNGTHIQWRFVGYTTWYDLVPLADLTPNIKVGSVEVVDTDEETDVSITGTRNNPIMNFKLPKGKDGVNGGDIINTRLNEKGEMLITVKNGGDDTLLGPDDNVYIMPVLSIGTVETLGEDEDAYVTITGTPTNPKLNFGIPRGKSTKIKEAYKDEDGFLHFTVE